MKHNDEFEKTKTEIRFIASAIEQRVGAVQNIIPRITEGPLNKNQDKKRDLEKQVNELDRLTRQLRTTLQNER